MASLIGVGGMGGIVMCLIGCWRERIRESLFAANIKNSIEV
jgi:hypothetical protein